MPRAGYLSEGDTRHRANQNFLCAPVIDESLDRIRRFIPSGRIPRSVSLPVQLSPLTLPDEDQENQNPRIRSFTTLRMRGRQIEVERATALSIVEEQQEAQDMIRRHFREEEDLRTAIAVSESMQQEENNAVVQEHENDIFQEAVHASEQQARNNLQDVVDPALQEALHASFQEPRMMVRLGQGTELQLPPFNSFPETLRERPLTFGSADLAQATLPDIYKNYRKIPTLFTDNQMWPRCAIHQQRTDLHINRGFEEIREWHDGIPEAKRCLVCLSNVATRVAVPCGHALCCRSCINVLVLTRYYYSVTSPSGEVLETDIRLPIRCFTCRAIIGLIITVH